MEARYLGTSDIKITPILMGTWQAGKSMLVGIEQLALAWLIAQPQTNAIAGARNAEQASQNATAGDVQLSADDLQEIDAIAQLVTNHLDENPVMWDWDSSK